MPGDASPQQKEELKSVYKRWLDEDVLYIITDEERKAFKALKTDEERDQFIEQFPTLVMHRRNPGNGPLNSELGALVRKLRDTTPNAAPGSSTSPPPR